MPTWTKADLEDYERKQRKTAELCAEPVIFTIPDSVSGKAQAAKFERPVRHEPLAAHQGKEGNSGRFRVSVEGRRFRLIDPDNLVPKYFIDCCRYAGLITDDSSKHIELTVTQTKVATKAEECTIITIEEIK